MFRSLKATYQGKTGQNNTWGKCGDELKCSFCQKILLDDAQKAVAEYLEKQVLEHTTQCGSFALEVDEITHVFNMIQFTAFAEFCFKNKTHEVCFCKPLQEG